MRFNRNTIVTGIKNTWKIAKVKQPFGVVQINTQWNLSLILFFAFLIFQGLYFYGIFKKDNRISEMYFLYSILYAPIVFFLLPFYLRKAIRYALLSTFLVPALVNASLYILYYGIKLRYPTLLSHFDELYAFNYKLKQIYSSTTENLAIPGLIAGLGIRFILQIIRFFVRR